MPSIIDKAKEKLPAPRKASLTGSPSTSRSSRRSPNGKSRGSPHERQIPPEPVQQNPDGDFSHMDADPPLQVHNLARAMKNVKKLDWDTRLAHDAEVYAKSLASSGIVEHSGVEAQGENIFVTELDNGTFEYAVQKWMNEEKKYHGEKFGEGNVHEYQNFSKSLYHCRRLLYSDSN